MWNATLQDEYEALTSNSGYAPLLDHFLIEMSGADRHAFLHNFCTADTKQLPVGRCTEAFILNLKGKTLAFVHVLAFEDSLWLVGAKRSDATVLIEHLDRYVIREDVQFSDLSQTMSPFFMPGWLVEQKSEVIAPSENECVITTVSELETRWAGIEIAGFGSVIVIAAEQKTTLEGTLRTLGLVSCSVEALAAVRIENGTPWSGSEANDTNLPQELQRDEKAISFNKGCYLGQETVARLDALGRVNQLLVRLSFNAADSEPAPLVGCELLADEKSVGRITSVAWSPQANSYLALAFVRRAVSKTGSTCLASGREVTVL